MMPIMNIMSLIIFPTKKLVNRSAKIHVLEKLNKACHRDLDPDIEI